MPCLKFVLAVGVNRSNLAPEAEAAAELVEGDLRIRIGARDTEISRVDFLVDESGSAVTQQHMAAPRMLAAGGEPAADRPTTRRSGCRAGWSIGRQGCHENRVKRMTARPTFASQLGEQRDGREIFAIGHRR